MTHKLLEATRTFMNRLLFARCCLELGHLQDGEQALQSVRGKEGCSLSVLSIAS